MNEVGSEKRKGKRVSERKEKKKKKEERAFEKNENEKKNLLTLLMPLDHVVGVAVVGGHQPPPTQRLADLKQLAEALVDEGAGPRRRGKVAGVPDLFLWSFFFEVLKEKVF